MNTKITFRITGNYDESIPDNNFETGTESIVCGENYDFEDYLRDRDVIAEEDEETKGFYWVLDCNGERTGEAYMVTKEEPTEEEPRDVG